MENINNTLENRVILGDIREVVNQLPDTFFQSIITSPPYFRHRSYSGGDSSRELGRETSVDNYISNIVDIFHDIRTKLKSDGLLWLNLGDTYDDKCLLGVPWRTALAMKDDGWILRSDIIWHKPNAMPASVNDRPTTDHEYVFLFSRSTEYYYNADAIREPHVTFTEKSRMKGGTPENGKNAGNPNLHNGRWDQAFHPKGRNKRTVWEIPLSKFRDIHFAVYPEKLVEICLLASTRENDYILDPFTGSGTTGVVACKYRRRFTGVELVKRYQEMAQERIDSVRQTLLFV
ncbi:MAG: site-specific DNA-methyltransferase [Dehalococcoidales bacterium]|nr:site-specific DNA-methyltransferase [Dehalococcoidales bacterium]